MHCDRLIDQGRDPRSRTYYIYVCNVCKHEAEFNKVPNFDTARLRKCPNCGVEDDTNDREYLIKRQQSLEQQIQSCETRMNGLMWELDTVTEKLKQFREPVPQEVTNDNR